MFYSTGLGKIIIKMVKSFYIEKITAPNSNLEQGEALNLLQLSQSVPVEKQNVFCVFLGKQTYLKMRTV